MGCTANSMCILYPKKTFKSCYGVFHITSHRIPAERRIQITLLWNRLV